MAAFSISSLSKCARLFQLPSLQNTIFKASYAKPALGGLGKKGGKGGKLGPVVEKKVLPVETDPEKLVNYVCGSNILKQGQDVKLSSDSEYPEWLWNLRLGKPPPLEEMDPNTIQYWRRLRKLNLRRNAQLMKLKKF